MPRPSFSVLAGVAAAVLLALLGAEAAWLRFEQQAARRAQVALAQVRQEQEWLATQNPALTEANEQALGRDLERARSLLAEARGGWSRGDSIAGSEPAPAQTLAAYFALAGFVEKSRAAATAARIALRPEERFGFTAYINEGPAPELLPLVHRQRQVAERLVEQLIEAHPRALLGWRREAPGPAGKAVSDDYFTLDQALSVRRPGEVDSIAYRVEFSGQTATLRNFLTGLAALPQPVLVRSVEVEPLSAPLVAAAPAARAPVPLVRQNLSKFSITVEAPRLVAAAASAGTR